MPKLKAYISNSDKSGYYILANVGGGHPITIQVTELGKRILNKAGYDDGDDVPTKVVWSMFDVGILYTSGTINDPPESVQDPEETFRQLGVANDLTTEERDRLLSYLDEYTGPNQAEITALRESLETSSTPQERERTVPEELRDDLDRLSTLHDRDDLTTAEYELLKSRLLDDLSPPRATSENFGATSNSGGKLEELHNDVAEALHNLVPEDKYETEMEGVDLEDMTTDEISIVYVYYHPNEGGYTYSCQFQKRSHEERMFELLEDDQWELVNDSSDDNFQPSVRVRRKTSPDGFRDELPSGFVDEELSHLLGLVKTVYGTSPSELWLSSEEIPIPDDNPTPAMLRGELESTGTGLNTGAASGYVALDSDINLNAIAIALGLDNITYEPNDFPGLIYHPEEPETTVVVFGNGVITSVDGKTDQAVKDGIMSLIERAKDGGLIDTDPIPQVKLNTETIPIREELPRLR